MQTKLLTLTFGLLLASCGDTPDTTWHLSQASDKGSYQATLECTTAPVVGTFQECSLQLGKQQAIPADLLIAVDGGMPAHGHGLPTAPQAIPTGKPGEFRIDGLKYSMPGEWVLGFLLHSATSPDAQDKVIFRFTLS